MKFFMSGVSENKDKITKELNPSRWVDLYADDLYRYAYFFLKGDGDKAADLVQDTFLAALENKESYKGIASEKTWLFTILKNKLLDYTRKASTKYETSIITDEKSERNEVSIFYFYNPRKNGKWNKEHEPKEWNTAEEQLLQKERSNILKKCMELLSERWRRILADTYLEEKKAEEICKENRITSSNYWVILHRSKVQLRECVERTLKQNGGKRV
jgi:RNA polymerase sigma-70 factor (ECF subfamily)